MIFVIYSRDSNILYSLCKDTICFSKILCILYHELWKLYFFVGL